MVGSVCDAKRLTTGSRNVENISLMTKGLERRRGSAESRVKGLVKQRDKLVEGKVEI
jgi:hypothetical protein